MLNLKIVILIIFTIILIIIAYKLNSNDICSSKIHDIDNNNYIENFESILSKLNTKNKTNKKNNNNNNNNNNKKNKSISFDELISNSEKFSKEKDNLESITDALDKYKKIFNSKKFKNNSKSTAESFEKFKFYKDKFFELFK